MPALSAPAHSAWRNRIVGHGDEDPARLISNPRNWRLHPKHQQDALRGVLDQVGFVQSVIVNQRSGFVVDGHARIALAISQKQHTIPVVYVDLDEHEEGMVLATLDPISALATSNADQLAALLAGLEPADAAVANLLRDLAPPRTKALNPDDADLTPPDEPITKPGDLWLLGEHRLLCGDSTNGEDVARLMGAQRADMVFTDPPYGVEYEGGLNARKRERLENDDRDMYGAAVRPLHDVTRDHAALYLWFADQRTRDAILALESYRWQVRALLIWNKLNAHYGTWMAQYMQRHEPFFYAYKRGGAPQWFGPTNEVTVWDVEQPATNPDHPTQKPVDLAHRAISNSSQPYDIVLDTFAGGGSTLIAAEQLDRRCYAMEIEPKYCDVIVRRWERVSGRQAVKANA